LILVMVVCLLFLFLFTGCDEDGTTSVTDDELTTLIMASLGSGFIPMMVMMAYPDNGTYDVDTVGDDMIVSGQLVVLNGVYTFTSCALDFDNPADGVAEMTIGGELAAVTVGAVTTITYTDFTLTGTMPGTVDPISITVAGAFVMEMISGVIVVGETAATFDVDITISGITASPADIIIAIEEIATVEGEPPAETEQELISATIDGEDYTAEFAEILASMFS